jgi:ribosomal protein L12E/L44/L45/RPP1/RPP2
MAWMITHLSPPTTIQSCEDDIAVNLIGVLAELLDVSMQDLFEVIDEFVRPPAAPAEPEPEPEAEQKPKRARKPKMGAEPVEEVPADAMVEG